MKFFDRVKMRTATTGAGDLALGAAPLGFRTLEQAGAADGDEVPYVISEGASFARGIGTWTESTNTLVRDANEVRWTGGVESTAKLSLAGTATVFVGLYAEILEDFANAASTATTAATNAEAWAASCGDQFGIVLTGSPVAEGGHIAAPSLRGPFTFTRFYALVEGGAADISVKVNDVEVHSSLAIDGEVSEVIDVDAVQGDRIDIYIDNCTATLVWAQVDRGAT